MRIKASCIVSSNLCRACSVWSSSVEFRCDKVYRSHSALEVSSNRHAEYCEYIFRSRFYSYVLSNSDKHRSQVKCSSCAVWRNPLHVCLNYLNAGIYEFLNRNLRHEQSVCAVVHSLCILIRSEKLNLAFFCRVSLKAFKRLLTIVKRRSTFFYV